jgi:protoheme IX farnesyltransferase
MARTAGAPRRAAHRRRPKPSRWPLLVGGSGLWLLHTLVNPLTMWLTLATFVGYAVIYTLLLKPATPMNIVIGGASGAMPPLLGWTAMTGQVAPEALVLFLIIFLWTPPHFWALACYRRDDYAKAGLPMLPVTHGIEFTCQHSLIYVVMLSRASPDSLHARHERHRLSDRRACSTPSSSPTSIGSGATTATNWPGAPSAGRSST